MSWLQLGAVAAAVYIIMKALKGSDDDWSGGELRTAANELARAQNFLDDSDDEDWDDENRAEAAERAIEHADTAISIASRYSQNDDIPAVAEAVRGSAFKVLEDLDRA